MIPVQVSVHPNGSISVCFITLKNKYLEKINAIQIYKILLTKRVIHVFNYILTNEQLVHLHMFDSLKRTESFWNQTTLAASKIAYSLE